MVWMVVGATEIIINWIPKEHAEGFRWESGNLWDKMMIISVVLESYGLFFRIGGLINQLAVTR